MHGLAGSYMGLGGFGWIFWLAVIIIIVWLVFRVILGGKNKATFGVHEEESALDILEKRYAKGEISKEEFEEKKKTLTKK